MQCAIHLNLGWRILVQDAPVVTTVPPTEGDLILNPDKFNVRKVFRSSFVYLFARKHSIYFYGMTYIYTPYRQPLHQLIFKIYPWGRGGMEFIKGKGGGMNKEKEFNGSGQNTVRGSRAPSPLLKKYHVIESLNLRSLLSTGVSSRINVFHFCSNW